MLEEDRLSKSPYKVLYITHLVDFGGGERGLYSIIERIDKGKFMPVVLCSEDGPLVAELRKINVKVIMVKFGIAKKFFKCVPVVSLFTMFQFAKIFARERIDIIHANGVSGLAFSALPAKIMNIPLVWSVHGWTSGARLQGVLINLFVSKIIAVSKAVRDFIGKPGCIPSDKIETIPLGVDLKRFHFRRRTHSIRNEFGIGEDVPLIGIVARLQAIKGHYYFLKAAQQIKNEFPGVKFLIVGAKLFSDRPEEGYPQSVRKLIEEFSLQNDCILTGFRNDIPEVLSALDIVVLPSLRESFGLVLVEAMAAGTAVIATRCKGPEDIIEDAVSGLLVPAKDPQALARAVSFVLTHKEKREELILAARRRVEDLFNVDVTVRKLENIYQDLRQKR